MRWYHGKLCLKIYVRFEKFIYTALGVGYNFKFFTTNEMSCVSQILTKVIKQWYTVYHLYKLPTSQCTHKQTHKGRRLPSTMTNGHFTTAIKICRGKRKVKWKEGENGHQGGSNKTGKRQWKFMRGRNKVWWDIPWCNTPSFSWKTSMECVKKKKQTNMQIKHPLTHTPDTYLL